MSGKGSRRQTGDALSVERLVPEVVAHVQEHPGVSQQGLEAAIEGRREHVRRAAKTAEEQNLIRREKTGKHGAWVHLPVGGEEPLQTAGETTSPHIAPTSPGATPVEPRPLAPIGGEGEDDVRPGGGRSTCNRGEHVNTQSIEVDLSEWGQG